MTFFRQAFQLVAICMTIVCHGDGVETDRLVKILDERVRSTQGLEIDTLRTLKDQPPSSVLADLRMDEGFEAALHLQETAAIFMWGPFSGFIDPYLEIRENEKEQSFRHQFVKSLDTGDWERSYNLALLRHQEDPENPHVLRTLASIAALRDDYESAVKFFLLHHPYEPENVPFLAGLGHALFNLGRFEKAETVIARVYELAPDFLPARFTYTALQIATNAPTINADKWELAKMGEKEQMASWLHADHAGLVRVLGEDGYVEMCEVLIGPKSYENIILIPDCLKQARSAFLQKSWNKAAVYYDLAFGFGVHGVSIMQQRARAYFELEREVEALKIMYDLTLRYKDVSVVWFNLGFILMQTEARSAALEAFDKAILLEPDNANFQFARACSLGVNGRVDEAWAILEELAKTHPEFMDSWLEGEAYYLKVFHQDPRFPALLASYSPNLEPPVVEEPVPLIPLPEDPESDSKE